MDSLRVALVVHGYPPELRGGTENTVQALARALARAGHAPLVFTGTDRVDGPALCETRDVDPLSGRSFPVYACARDDLFHGHWTKGFAPRAGRVFEELLARARPDVVHVHHWVRLTRDLVQRAARAGVPGVLTLHDLSSTCLVYFRVKPGELSFCEAPLAPEPCLDCAARVFRPTPWLTRAEQAQALLRLRDCMGRELAAARVVTALCADQARTLERFLESAPRILALAPASLVELEPAVPPPLAPDGAAQPLVLGCWATVHVLKGTDLLIEALRILERRGVALELHLAGIESDPSYLARLRESARGLSVVFHGPFERLAGHAVTRVHAFVAGTRARETWGVVLDEALALRLPLVLPRFGAYAERLREGRGVLFYERGDVQGLAAVLERLAREPGLLARLRAELPPLDECLPDGGAQLEQVLALYRQAIRLGPAAVAPLDPEAEARDQAYLERWDLHAARGE